MDTSYDFYIEHNMHAVERKLNMIIAKNPHLINKAECNERQPVVRNHSPIPFKN